MLIFLLLALVVVFVVLPLIGMALWAFLTTVLVGLVLGAVARLLVPGSEAIGWAKTIISGLIGSIVGGFLAQHVIGAGWFVTLILEVVIAAVAIAGFEFSRRGRELEKRA